MRVKVLLHVIGSGKLFGAAHKRTWYRLLRCVDFRVSGCVARCGEGLFAAVCLSEPARISLPWPFPPRAGGEIVVVRGRLAVAVDAGSLGTSI